MVSRNRERAGSTARDDRLRDCGLNFSVASRPEQVLEAWRLVHREYVRTGLIHPHRHRVHTHPHAFAPGTAVIIGTIRSLVVSTMTVCVDRTRGLPLDETCRPDMQTLRDAGRHLVEMGLFADRREQIARSLPALLNLMRHAFFYAVHAGATDIVIGVHPHHVDFYRRVLGFDMFAEATHCARVNDHPMVPMRMDMHAQLNRTAPPKGIAYFKANPLDAQAYSDRLEIDRTTFAGTAVGRYLRDLGLDPAGDSDSDRYPAAVTEAAPVEPPT